MKYCVDVAGRSFEIEIEHDRLAWVNGRPIYLDLEQVGGLPVYSLTLDAAGYMLFVEEGQEEYRVEVRGRVYPAEVRTARPQLAPAETGQLPVETVVRVPLAGYLVSLAATSGECVEAGQVVAVVESMKMQMELKAPCAGTVVRVHGPSGRDVCRGEVLVEVDAVSAHQLECQKIRE